MGSRDQLCNNGKQSESSGTEKNLQCGDASQKGNYNYFWTLTHEKPEIVAENESKIMDIEEPLGVGTKDSFSSYYYSKFAAETSDIIFMPYNYITNGDIRKNMNKLIKNSILIFDEAHNLDKIAEESASKTLGTTDLEKCEDEFNDLMKDLPDKKEDFLTLIKPQLEEIIHPIRNLRENLYEESAKRWENKPEKQNDGSFYSDDINTEESGNYIFDVITKKTGKPDKEKQLNTSQEEFHTKSEFINGMIDKNSMKNYLYKMDNIIKSLKETIGGEFINKSVYIQKWYDFVGKVYSHLENREKKLNWSDTTINHFRLFFKSTINDKKNCSLCLSCMDAGVCFKEIVGESPYNILLTSGTLNPIDTYK